MTQPVQADEPDARIRLPALQSRPFRIFWFGQTISLTGTWVQSVAQQWLVLQLTHSAFQVGLVVTVQFMPLLVLVLFTGPVADRVDKRFLLLLTQVASLVLATILATLTLFHLVRFWHILLLAGALGLVNAFYTPTRQSFVPQLVPRQHLMNAVALNSAIFNAARVVGPALGGLLYAAVGPAMAFYINAASYLAVIAGLLMIRDLRETRGIEREPSTYLTDLLEGFRYILRETRVMVILALVGISSLFALNFTTLLPVFSKFVLHLSSTGFGVILTAQGAGSLLAAIGLSVWNRPDLARRLIYGGAFTFLILEIVFAFVRSYVWALVILLPIGFCITLFSTTANSRILDTTPSALQGRVMSVYSLMFLGLTPIGSFLAGAVAERWGSPIAFLLGAGITLAATVLIFVWRARSRAAAMPNYTGAPTTTS